MLGKNPVERAEISGDGSTLRVVGGKPWFTIQGEGPFAGRPAVFLRLHGCPLRCFFCDTEFSNPEDPTLSTDVVVGMIKTVAPPWCDLLVITGGEPVRQDLSWLIDRLVGSGWTVQVETAGIMWQPCLLDTVIVCSPKTGRIHDEVYKHAHAFKYVVRAGENSEFDGLPVTNTQVEGGRPMELARPRPNAPIYLSPMDEQDADLNQINREEVARIAMKYNYRVGLQIHKFVGVP